MQFLVGAGILAMTAYAFSGEVKYEESKPGQESEFAKARDQMLGKI